MKSIKQKLLRKNIKNTTRKKSHGGKTFASSKPIKLFYKSKQLLCEVCNHDMYEEIIGTLGKSKVRSGLAEMVLGDFGKILDTTSIIVYVCKDCGNCKMIRNTDDDKMVITAQEVVV